MPGSTGAEWAQPIFDDATTTARQTRRVGLLPQPENEQRIAGLESAVASLKSEVEELRRLFSEFAGQFK